MQKIFKVRIVGKFFQRAPVLLSGFLAQFLADGRQIQPMFLFHADFIVIFMIMMIVVMIMRVTMTLRTLQDAKLVVVWLIAHIVR